MKGFYFITDRGLSRKGNISDVKSALAAGVRVIQYREKYASTKEMYEEALRLRRLCKNITFLINDRIDIALSVNADGVHLGQDDLPYQIARKILGKNKIIGVTVHNLEEAKVAEERGTDYLSISPIFATSTKQDAGKPTGVELISKIRRHTRLPIVAIGGINLINAPKIIRAGADGICAISAVLSESNLKAEIEKFQALFCKHPPRAGGKK